MDIAKEFSSMNTNYTDEKNTQIVLGLLKAHGIKRVIASPGTTNIRLVASMQQDPFFKMYSAADERSAAYIACGMAAESGEPVVLSCTGATASRNYIPGLTEAFYRKLPVLAITSTQHTGRIGQNIAQVLDRSQQQKDIVKLSVQIPTCHTQEDEWACNLQVNNAILELTRNGGGPVHIDLETTYSRNFNVTELPKANPIYRYGYNDELPKLPKGRIGIFVGAHKKMSDELTSTVDAFCKKYNAVVLCDHTSNYYGRYRVLFSLVTSQDLWQSELNSFDLLIYIGDISGAYPNFKSKAEWRVNPDGEIRDTFKHLKNVFQMDEQFFFEHYAQEDTVDNNHECEFVDAWNSEYQRIYDSISELPFSNIWIAKNTSSKLPQNSILHLGILNSLRSWNFFEIPENTEVSCNTGGFGIDGIVSTAIGAALANPEKNVYCVLGDLAFFYDLNSLGNHHVMNNIRILLINNGKGVEFRNYNHFGAQFGDDADQFVAAAGHYGSQSKDLVKHYATDLGFEYMTADSKEEYLDKLDRFITPELTEKPMVFEVFTDWKDESDALHAIRNTIVDSKKRIKKDIKTAVKNLVGEKGVSTLKKLKGK